MFQFIEYAKIRYCTPPADWSTKNKPGTAEDTVLWIKKPIVMCTVLEKWFGGKFIIIHDA